MSDEIVRDSDERRNLGQLLRAAFDRWVTELHAGLDAAGFADIRPAHGNVFQFIGAEGCTLTELAERASLTKQSMAYLVDHLQERSYVERVPDPRDGRAKILRLTPHGWEAVEAAWEVLGRVEAGWAAAVGADRLDRLRRDLIELAEIGPAHYGEDHRPPGR